MYVKSPLMKALAFSSATFLLSAQAYAGNCCFKGKAPECEQPAPKPEDTKTQPQPESSSESQSESDCSNNDDQTPETDSQPTPQPEPEEQPEQPAPKSDNSGDDSDEIICKPKPDTTKGQEIPDYDPEVPSDYEDWTDCEKLNFTWKQIKASAYNPLPPLPKAPSAYEQLVKLFKLRQQGESPFSYSKDFLEKAEMKAVNVYGVVAPMHLEPTDADHPFTGLYDERVLGLMRISSVMSPGPKQKGKYELSVNLKFFVDGQSSKNLATTPLEKQEKPWNTFSAGQSTQVEASGSSFLTTQIFKALNRINNRSSQVSTEPLAEVDSFGNAISSPIAPEAITLQPTAYAQASGFIQENEDFRMNLHVNFKKGDKLYDVYGLYEGKQYLIGTLILEAPFVASSVGDQYLFFQYNKN